MDNGIITGGKIKKRCDISHTLILTIPLRTVIYYLFCETDVFANPFRERIPLSHWYSMRKCILCE